MLLKRETLRGIRDGSIALVFRVWTRPTVKAGGTLLTSIGRLAIEAVDRVALEDITDSEAARAGFPDGASLRSELSRRREGHLYRVRVSLAGPDPRVGLRQRVPEGEEQEELVRRLARLDSRAPGGAWTHRVLALLGERPQERAADLARDIGMDLPRFKRNVRTLKGMGLTESLEVGYRLSPRGRAVLRVLDGSPGARG